MEYEGLFILFIVVGSVFSLIGAGGFGLVCFIIFGVVPVGAALQKGR